MPTSNIYSPGVMINLHDTMLKKPLPGVHGVGKEINHELLSKKYDIPYMG